MRYLPPLLALALLALPVVASEPGEPLDCSDWVFLEPGLSCSMVIGPDYPNSPLLPDLQEHNALDSRSNFFHVRGIDLPPDPACGGVQFRRTELVRFNSLAVTVIAYVEDRCHDPVLSKADTIRLVGGMKFDHHRARLYLRAHNSCTAGGCGYLPPWSPSGGSWLLAIDGFAASFDSP